MRQLRVTHLLPSFVISVVSKLLGSNQPENRQAPTSRTCFCVCVWVHTGTREYTWKCNAPNVMNFVDWKRGYFGPLWIFPNKMAKYISLFYHIKLKNLECFLISSLLTFPPIWVCLVWGGGRGTFRILNV